MIRCVVLDAMGVMFNAADDVAELLIPFVQSASPGTTSRAIESAYLAASLGDLSADEFWKKLGLDPELEDQYLRAHSVVRGTLEFLKTAHAVGVPIWCLSNDVERWSHKLRATFGIDGYLEGAVISSAARARKPSAEIYRILLERSGYVAEEVIFVDDRRKNVDAAKDLGFEALQFSDRKGYDDLRRMVLGSAA